MDPSQKDPAEGSREAVDRELAKVREKERTGGRKPIPPKDSEPPRKS